MRFALVAIVAISCVGIVGCAKKGPKERPPLSPERIDRLHTRFLTLWDSNKDGTVTCSDITAKRRQTFNQLDVDRNNRLSAYEYGRVAFEDKSFRFHDFKTLDENINGSLDFDEFNRVQQNQFVSADKNSDCIISPPEAAESLRDQFRERSGGRGRDGRRGDSQGRPPRQN